ncbi:ubinuclein-1-like isoform X2 [Polyodon spathula]|uniref:ubinuclein-1-like isoform X2 n=1 Tax=Polyodon spathula TaxID=7913 RepID=UPI001B7F6401|nr:ubinuclein-1-like isoform X2 [Polyodon spathula]
MAEPRSMQLTTLSGSETCLPTSLLKKPQNEGAVVTPVDPKRTDRDPTARLVLALFQPDQRHCPEFNYPELVKKTKKDSVKESREPFEEDEDEDEGKRRLELEVLAKKFEERYGPKKRKKDHMQDLFDMGYGYDDTDPFIDNSEAYDELVPASLTTKYGGFYINSGTLQFRQASESEPDDDLTKEKKMLKSPKKRKLKDGSEKVIKKKKEEGQHKESQVAKAGIMPLNPSKEEKKKNKKFTRVLSVKKMFQKEKEAFEKEDGKPLSSLQPVAAPPRALDSNLSVSDPLLSLIGCANESDLHAASTIDLGDIDLEKLLYDSPAASPLDLDEGSDPLSGGPGQVLKQSPVLPEGLPAPLERRIKELTQAAKASEGEGKQKFFTQEINNMLLDKDTLIKRAKKLHLHEQDGRLKEPLHKLKAAIGRVMPGQSAKYQDDCQARTQAKFAKMLEEGKEKERSDEEEEEGDEEKNGKRVMSPRKKFQWNDEIREFLCNVVRIKMGSYELERNKSQSAEKYLKAFLEAEVKPLWPKGWMQARMLFKESRRVHSYITSIPTKKKVINPPKIKMKDPIVKVVGSTSTSLLHSGGPAVLAQGPGSNALSPVGFFIPASATAHGSSTLHSFTGDDSLDEDLIHNPPSLQGVSEELAALNSAARGSPDLCFSAVHKPTSANLPVLTSSDEKNNFPKPVNATPVTTSAASSQSPLNLLAEQALVLGQLSQERKSQNCSTALLSRYKGLLSQTSTCNKVLSDSLQTKHKNLSLLRTTSSSVQSLKPFHQTSESQKSFPSSAQFSISQLQSLSQSKASTLFQQCASMQQSKTAAKTQPFHPPHSSLPCAVQASSVTVSKILSSTGSSVSYMSSTYSQVYKPTFSLPAKSSVLSSSSAHSASVSTGILLNRKSPSINQTSSLQSQSSTVKKPVVSQKLTLVAPPGGTNGDSTMGTQGVARLLTSSLKPVVVTSCSTSASSLKNVPGAAVPSSSPSLSLLSPSFTSSGETLAPGTLSILPDIIPVHTFSFPVLSFGSDSKAGGSKDAVVTGPAPGTLHHGLAPSIFAGLHASAHHTTQLPQPTQSTHLQQSLQDGSQIHGENSNAQRKLQ